MITKPPKKIELTPMTGFYRIGKNFVLVFYLHPIPNYFLCFV
jgi:hypothetical protein